MTRKEEKGAALLLFFFKAQISMCGSIRSIFDRAAIRKRFQQ